MAFYWGFGRTQVGRDWTRNSTYPPSVKVATGVCFAPLEIFRSLSDAVRKREERAR